MLNAMVNIAIKKFSNEPDYAAFFVKEEFKEEAKAEVKQDVEKEVSKVSNTQNQTDFSSW